MKRVLVGVDGSEVSSRAVQLAAELVKPDDGEVVTAHVVLPPAYPSEVYPIAAVDLEKQARRFGQMLADRAAEVATGLGVRAHGEVLSGAPPAEALSEAAENGGFDLVVVGSRGLGAVKRVLLGSTSERVVRTCLRPVLVVH